MSQPITIKVSDWSKTPNNNGLKFRKEIFEVNIKDAIDMNYKIIVDLNNTLGYRPSFLKEAFIGVIRDGIVSFEEFTHYVEFKSDKRPSYLREIIRYSNEIKNINNVITNG